MKVAKIFSVVIVGVGLISASAIATARTVSLKFSRVGTPFIIPDGPDGISDPGGIAVDGKGNIYVTDRKNNRVDELDSNGDNLHMFGGPSNPADPSSGLSNPNGIAVTSSGSVYVADTNNNRVNLYRDGKLVSSYGNNSKKPDQKLKAPTGVSIDRATGKIYVTSQPFDKSSNRSNVVVLKNQSDSLTLSSTFSIPNPKSGNTSNPAGIAVDGAGNIYVTDNSNNRVIKFDKNHSPTNFSPSGTDNQGFGDSSPNGIDADDSDVLYVADTGNNRLSGYEDDGEYLNDYGNNGTESLSQPQAATVERSTGKVYVISQPLLCNTDNGCFPNNSRIVVLKPTTTTK